MKVEDQLALILTKLDEQSKGISETNRRLHDVHDSVAELTAAHADFERWRPQVDGQVKDLRLTVDSLCQQLDDLKASSLEPGSAPFKVSGSAHLDPSCSTATPGPLGHGDATHHRSDGSGVVYMTTHEPPPVTDDTSMQFPELVLDRRATTRNNRLYHQLLVQWHGSPPELATWEDEDDLLRRFPQFTAWGQAVANGGGNVTVRTVDSLKLSKRKKRPNTKYAGPDWSK